MGNPVRADLVVQPGDMDRPFAPAASLLAHFTGVTMSPPTIAGATFGSRVHPGSITQCESHPDVGQSPESMGKWS